MKAVIGSIIAVSFTIRQSKNDSRRDPEQRAGGEFLIEVLKAKRRIAIA